MSRTISRKSVSYFDKYEQENKLRLTNKDNANISSPKSIKKK